MHKILFLMYFLHFTIWAQSPKENTNAVSFGIGNSTPIFGVNYQKSFAYKSKKYQKHWEFGGGIGIIPKLLPLGLDISFGHSISYFIGKNKTFFKVGYSGVLGKSQPDFSVYNNYLPAPHVGFRYQGKRHFCGVDVNGYFYRDNKLLVKEDNSIFKIIQTKLSFYPGFYFGFNLNK